MKVLRWLGKHKIWAYVILMIILPLIYQAVMGSYNPEAHATIFMVGLVIYLPIIWAYSRIKRGKQ